ncbi:MULTISPECIES: HD domain-containing protein [Bacillaceae]|jgi:(p)ppGpp synthase/HD superfamily hydrolase|uniref:HD domain-containing protein n=1 Tax=Bacillaceae TaxID=186817 RepID=UPI00203CA606|nr:MULTISPECIES: HD domain-containing protein [Bacillaceae]MCM3476601.1 HD domain-containing protein [Caldibacillus thermoamylovorans]MEC5271947.1 HD domain-containing protein [Caldifermentibacillus hisashii]
MSVIEKAIEVAAKAHDHQYRKGTNLPYISHPYTVGVLLLTFGYAEEVVAAGILHDTVEDTDLTLDDIKKDFGERIADIVRGASEKDKSLSWEERKQATIDHLATEPRDVCLIVCADKLHNLTTIKRELEREGEKVWTRFKRGREKQAWYYREVVHKLENKIANERIFVQLKNEVISVFGKEK